MGRKLKRILGILLIALATERPVGAFAEAHHISSEQRRCRLEHAHELLGKHYRHSCVQVGESVHKINSQVYRWTRARLPEKYKKHYQEIAQALIDESLKYEFDPVFLMSVVESESSFRPKQKGRLGEIGLMQIKPTTGRWIAQKYSLPWKGSVTLLDPVANIRIGAAYLSYLRERFDMHARLYLSAYNLGQKNVDLARQKSIWPRDYVRQVMKHYVLFYQELRHQESLKDQADRSMSSVLE